MKNNIILSIIIPIYNGEKYLNNMYRVIKLIESQDIEIIIIDDGSTDNTNQVLTNFHVRNCKIIYQDNGGVSAARNRGIEIAKGKYIFFCDIDDEILVNNFINSKSLLFNNYDLIISNYMMKKDNIEKCYIPNSYGEKIDSKTCILKLIGISEHDLSEQKFHNITGAPWRFFFKTSILKEYNIRFNEKLEYGEDLLFAIEVLTHCEFVKINNKSIYLYNREENSMTVSKIKDYDQFFIKMAEQIFAFINNIAYIDKTLFFNYVIKNICKSICLIVDYNNHDSFIKKYLRIKNINKTSLVKLACKNSNIISYKSLSISQRILYFSICFCPSIIQLLVFKFRSSLLRILGIDKSDYNM